MKKIILLLLISASIIGMQKHSLPEIDNEECSICSSQLHNTGEDVITFGCHKTHAYHISCINQWRNINPSCPNCRRSMIPDNKYDKHFANYILSKRESSDDVDCTCLTIMRALFPYS